MEWRYWPFPLHRRVVLRSEKSLRQSVAPWTHCKIKCCRNPGLGAKMVRKFPRKSQPCYCGQRPRFFTSENPRGSSSRCNSQSSAVFYLWQRHNKSQRLRLWHQLIRRWHFSIRVIANCQCTSSQASASLKPNWWLGRNGCGWEYRRLKINFSRHLDNFPSNKIDW